MTNFSDQLEQISKHIFAEYEAGRLVLPSLPEVITRIQQAIQDKNRGTQQIARLIQLDVGLAARLVQVANSPMYQSRFPVENCQTAIMRLGVKTTRNLVTCFAMHNIFNSEIKSLHLQIRQLWKHSCQVAAICYVLAQLHKGQLQPDKAMLAGLIHDIGVLPVLYYIADYPDIRENKALLAALIDNMRGVLGRKILEKWAFDKELLDVPMHAEDWLRDVPGKLDYVDLVVVAQAHSYMGGERPAGIPALIDIPAFKKMHLSSLGPAASIELLHESQEEIQNMVQMLLQ